MVPENLRINEEQFIDKLRMHMDSIGQSFRIPTMGGKPLDLLLLFKSVYVRGGSKKVDFLSIWAEICKELKLPPTCTSAAPLLQHPRSI